MDIPKPTFNNGLLMEFKLKNKVALVTGGSRGIGRSVALMLAEQGMHIVICGRTKESLEITASDIRKFGVNAWAIQADVSKIRDIEAFVAEAFAVTGRIDVLVNNAVTSTSATFDELTDDLFQYHIDVKLMAYIRLARLVLPYMKNQSWGRIVNIGGMTARIVAPLRITNGVVNAGVANFTKQLANNVACHNITVNCVHPGMTETERMMQVFEREAKEANIDVNTIRAKRTADIPLGKLIRPEDIASTVLYFCSPLAEMVTGQSIAVDGGSGGAVIY